jgi:hypothetical protein
VTRSKVLSVLALAGVLVGLTLAQGPKPPAGKSGAKPADPKQPDATAEALRNHPDIRLAEAKVRMAEAELAQAKLLVAQRIAIAEAKVQEYKVRMEYSSSLADRLRGVVGVSNAEMLALDKDVAAAKAALIGAEAELAAARGLNTASAPQSADERLVERARMFLKAQQAGGDDASSAFLAAMLAMESKQVPAGSATDKLRELLDKRVPMRVGRAPFTEVLAAFVKHVDLQGVTIRSPEWANPQTLKNPPQVGPLEGEQTVAGWLQLILDDFNRSLDGVPADLAGKYDIYVREYGLLMTKTNLAPPGALTLSEYVRQLRTAKAIEKEKAKQ